MTLCQKIFKEKLMKDLLEFRDVSLSYHTNKNEIVAIKNMSFSVKEKQFVSIVGPSGCGKTTLLSIVAGLLKPSSGSVFLEGEEIKNKINTRVGYMFQRDNLFDWLNVYQNICLGLSIKKIKTPENIQRAKILINKYGLEGTEKLYPSQLSGGMRQRVALIRTLATNPDILLLDEPFSAVDFQTRLVVQDDIHKIIKSEQKTALLVTHDISEAVSMSDRVLVLSSRPSYIKQDIYLDFSKNKTPFLRRSDSKFSTFFNEIWEVLKNEEKNNSDFK